MIVRGARLEDAPALKEIDRATWSHLSSAATGPPPGPFFNSRTLPENVLVAERDGRIAGWAKIEHPTDLPASEHVWHVTGLAVDPDAQGGGVGRALMDAVVAEARRRGGRRLTLRVFAPNERARHLYDALGFQVEGVLRGEFFIGGEYVDDLCMALALTG